MVLDKKIFEPWSFEGNEIKRFRLYNVDVLSTMKVDGVTPLDIDDLGRVEYLTTEKIPYQWTGTEWIPFGNSSSGNRKFIPSNLTIKVADEFQHFIYGNFGVEGRVKNFGEIVIVNGSINVIGDGQLDSFENGQINILNLKVGV